MEVFADNESGYREWVQTNPFGFVLVSWNPPRPKYISLHRADCHCINPQKAPHRQNWTKAYIKVCADSSDELVRWAAGKWGSGVADIQPCRHCQRAGRV
jgi:hypothetical protein